MTGINSLADLIGQGASTGVGIGIGIPLAGVLQPTAVDLVQNAWGPAPIKVLDVEHLARIVAQDLMSPHDAHLQANATGIANDRFDLVAAAERNGPAFGQLLSLIRRGYPTEEEIAYALRKMQLEPKFDAMMLKLADERLDLGALATAIHRGIIAGGGLLLQEPPTTPGAIDQVPPSDLDPLAEAAAHGIDKERLRVLVGNTGLPLALGEMLQLLNRGEVTEDDVKRAVAESNIRNEYMDKAVTLRRRLLTPHEYAEAELRGLKSTADAQAGAALSGLEADDYRTLFGILGRPLNEHQIVTGLARGGDYGGTYADVPEGPFRDSIRRSAIRPEYAKLAYANRYTYPSPFVLRSLAQAGTLGTTADVEQMLLEIGWKPSLAAKVAADWTTQSTADTHVGKAQTQLWTAAHKAYLNGLADDTEATADLTAAGVDPAAIPSVLTLWAQEREVTRRSLTPTQVKKAIGQPGLDAAWAKARLLKLGYSPADADAFLLEK